MSEVLKMSKKALTAGVVATTIAWSMGLAALLPTVAHGATAGTLVKASLPAVYYVGGDGKRYVFPNEKTFKTWYADFSSVTTITDAELAAMPIGGNVTYKPGSRMVKITTDPKVYAVDAHGTLRWISSEAVAVAAYGSTWNKMIDDVADAFFTNYSLGNDITAVGQYDRAAVTAAATSINVDKNLGAVNPINQNLTVTVSASGPVGGTLPMLATSVNMVKVDVRNGSSSAVTVDSLTVRRSGPGSSNDFANVYVYEGNTRLTTGRTINGTTNEASFSGLNLALAAGETKTVWIAADFNGLTTIPAAKAGDVSNLSIVNLAAGTSVAAGLPVAGPSYTLAGVEVGNVTIDKSGSISNPKAGQTGAKVAEFKISANTEDVKVGKVALYYAGSVSRSNITNLVLKQAGLTVATVAGLTSKDLAVFALSNPFTIEKGNSRIFEVYADIAGTVRANEEVIFYVDQNSDVTAIGSTYGFGVGVTRPTYGNTVACTTLAPNGDCSYSKVEAGQMTVTFNGPSAKDISANGKDVEMLNFTMAAQANLEVRKIVINTTAVGDVVTKLSDVKIVDTASGAIVAGPMNGAAAMNFTEIVNLAPGQARTFKVTADVDNTTLALATYKLTLVAIVPSDVRNLDNSTNLKAGDIVPTANIVGNTMTVKKPSLTISTASTPSTQTYIQGAQGIALYGIGLKAGDASDVKVNSIKITGYIDSNAAGVFTKGTDGVATLSDELLSASLWDGSTQVGPTRSPGVGADGTMVFDNLNLTIAKGQMKSLVLKGNLTSAIATLVADVDRMKFDVATDADISATDADGSTVAGPYGACALATCLPAPIGINGLTADNGVRMTLSGNGTVSVAKAADDTESEAGLVVGGASNVVLAKYKFQANDEELKATKLSFKVAGASAAGVSSLSLYDGSTLVGGPVSVEGSGDAHFTGLSIVIPKDGSKVVTVKANLASVGISGVATGSDVGVTLKDTAGVYSFEVRGTSAGSSTQIVAITGGDKPANPKIIRKSKPTISLVSLPTTTLSSGDQTLVRFTVAADAAGDVALSQIVASLSSSIANGAGKGVSSSGANLTLRRVGGDYLNAAVTYTSSSTDAICDNTDTSCSIKIALAAEEVIAAGTSKSFEIIGKIGGAVANDSVSTKILDDAADATNTAAIVGAAKNFVWSDMSAQSHALTTTDWAAGFKVKGLPTDSQTLVK